MTQDVFDSAVQLLWLSASVPANHAVGLLVAYPNISPSRHGMAWPRIIVLLRVVAASVSRPALRVDRVKLRSRQPNP